MLSAHIVRIITPFVCYCNIICNKHRVNDILIVLTFNSPSSVQIALSSHIHIYTEPTITVLISIVCCCHQLTIIPPERTMPTTTFFNSIYPQFPFENRKSEFNGREDGRDMAREGCGAVRLMEIINQSRNNIIYEDACLWIVEQGSGIRSPSFLCFPIVTLPANHLGKSQMSI